MLFTILKSESGISSRDCLRVIYSIIHNNIVTMKLLSQGSYINTIISYINLFHLYNKQQTQNKVIDLSIYPLILAKAQSEIEKSKNPNQNADCNFYIELDLVRYSILVFLFISC
jgi:hypothetical protein